MLGMIEPRRLFFDTLTNEMRILDQEEEIRTQESAYYKKRRGMFYDRGTEDTDPVSLIRGEKLFMLKEIKRILDKNRARYRVVLSPLYEQQKFNPKDLAVLRGLFGNDLYDFSGKNSLTEPYPNYYETAHFRTHVGDSILNRIYQNP